MGNIVRISRSFIDYWAIGGGILLFAVVFMNALSVGLNIFWNPIPGDVELTEMGVAVSVFAFLPYCQLHYSNVSADIFTSRASPSFLCAIKAIASIFAIILAILLFWWMFKGMVDRYNFNYLSAILLIPMWIPFAPVLLSLVLLMVASTLTLIENLSPILANKVT